MGETILRLPEVIKRTGLSRSTIRLQVMDGTFPESVKLGPRARGWVESDIEDWIQDKIVEREPWDPEKDGSP